MTQQAPASWHPDPFRRHELRYWDGGAWTEHVVTRGTQSVDLPVASPAPPPVPVAATDRAAKRAQRYVQDAGVTPAAQSGGGTLFTEHVLVVSQKVKLVEVHAEYAVHDQNGRKIGAVREVGQNLVKKAAQPYRLTSRRLQIVDANGELLLTVTCPVAVVKAKVIVRTADGTEVGQIVQKWASVLGKASFSLESGGAQVGSLNGEDLSSWDFNILDAQGNEAARISKTSRSIAKELFTKADNYVVTINRPLEDPLRSLVIAAALAVDTVLRQGQERTRLL